MIGASWIRPSSLEEAVALLQQHGDHAHLLAGGTALALLRRQELIEVGVLVDLAGVPGLTDIGLDGGHLRIGSMCTLRRVETDQVVRAGFPILAKATASVATIRIRNQATLGGNLAHADPAQDPPPVLLALDATAELWGPEGARSVVLDEFFVDVFETALGPAEVLVAVRVPEMRPGSRASYVKFLPRTVDDYATVSAAARLDLGPDGRIADARLALGAVAAVPLRVRQAESLLAGRTMAEVDLPAVAAAVREVVDPVDDARGSADYKRDMAGVWATRAVARLMPHHEAMP